MVVGPRARYIAGALDERATPVGHTVKRTFELSEEQSRYVDRLVESGRFASADAMIAECLAAYEDGDIDLSDWQIAAAGEAYDEARAHPESLMTLKEVRARMAALHEETVKKLR